MAQPKKLLDQVRDAIRTHHYSIRTEDAYVSWIKRFILYHGKKHPSDMGSAEIEAFLTHLATERNVAASTCRGIHPKPGIQRRRSPFAARE